MSFATTVNGSNIEFRLNTPASDDDAEIAKKKAERLALGELVSLITCTPADPTGETKNVWFPDFEDQDIKSAVTSLQYYLYSPLKGDGMVQLYDFRDDEARRYGRYGWIHFTRLDLSKSVTRYDWLTKVKKGNRVVNKQNTALITNPREFNKDWGLYQVKDVDSEWLRLVKKTDYSWRAVSDDTLDDRTGVGWGSLLASNRLSLHQGVTYRVSPRIWSYEMKSGDNKGELRVMDAAQKNAQRLLVSLQAVEAGEITIEEAGRQFFQDRLFTRIAYQDADKAESLSEETSEAMVDNAKAHNAGEVTSSLGLVVTFEGETLDLNDLPRGNYVTRVDGNGKATFHENRSFLGQKRLAADVQKLGDRLTVEKAVSA